MALASRRIRSTRQSGDYWPGFVDAMATLLLVIIFLLSIFMLAQFFLSQALSGRDEALNRLRSEISELSAQLNMARRSNQDLKDTLAQLSASLDTAESEKQELQAALAEARSSLEGKTELSEEARAEVELANQQIAALRRQIAALEAALDAAEERDRKAKAQITLLGKRLNAALAQKVQELARYRSEFFGRLREVLGERKDIHIVGDRFVFQSEILFDSASAELNAGGRGELDKLAEAILNIAGDIPEDIPWVLRVDGHSDARPISTAQFPSNWHLSAERAIAVVRFLINRGVPPERLMAAGFGAHQPLDPAETVEAYRKNRRIEFKLTQR